MLKDFPVITGDNLNCLGIFRNAHAIAETVMKTSHNLVEVEIVGQGMEPSVRENLGPALIVFSIKVKLGMVSLNIFKCTFVLIMLCLPRI